MMNKNIQENKEPVFAPRGGKPGYIVNGKWYPVDKQDLNTPQLKVELERYAKLRGKSQLEKDQASLNKPKPAPAPAPTPTPSGGTGGSGSTPAKPAPTPSPASSGGGTPSKPSPKPAPAAPKPSPVADYMKAAAAARKSGDPAEMAKVRDMGMEIWAKKYKTTLAPKVQPGQSGYETIQKVVNPPAPAQTPTTPTPQVTPSKDTEMNKTADELSKNPLSKKETKKEAYDIVLDYIFAEGHADTLSEAHYVMLQMNAEHIQNIIQERAWWDPAGLFMSKREKEVEKAKSTPTGARGSYNPDTGRTYNPTAKDQARATGVIAPRGGIVGTMEPGKPSTWQRYAPGSDAFRRQNIDRYVTVRGREQIQLDDLKNRAMKDKAKRDAAADAAFDKKYGVNEPPGDEFAGARKNTRAVVQPKPTAAPRTTSRPAATAPAAPKPKPQPPTIQSKNVTATGTSYERRTPTSAELAAAKAAGGGEAGIKAAVDVAKTNKVAATSPTPDLKPEAPKETPKRESLAAQVKELQAMRKAAEERNK